MLNSKEILEDKRNLLDSSYMNPAKFFFYACETNPNGTSDLIITDNDGQIIDVIESALFNPTLDVNRNGHTLGGAHLCLYDSVCFMEDVEGTEVPFDGEQVFPILLDDIFEDVAISPVQTEDDIFSAVLKAIA